MKITINNYFREIQKIGLENLPETLQKGHEFVFEITNSGEDFDNYRQDKDIKETVDLYFGKLEEFAEKNKDKAKTVKLKKPKLTKVKTAPKANAEPKAQPEPKKNTVKAPKAEKAGAAKKVAYLKEEVKYIKRYVGLHNKVKTPNAILNFIKALQKSIVQKLISKTSPLADEIRRIQDNLIKGYNKSNNGVLKITINESDLGRLVSIAGGEEVFSSIAIIKRFIGMQGKAIGDEKTNDLLKTIHNAFEKGKMKDDPYESRVKTIQKALTTYKSNSDKQLRIAESELNGLNGIVKSCSCHKGMGRIYHTGGKKLRGCGARTYSDAKRQGACSHNKGLYGVLTAEQMASREFDMLDFSGKWANLIGRPAKNFTMMIHGEPGSGKTTFLFHFVKYLSSLGSVLFVSSEEFDSVTLSQKVREYLNPIPKNIHFASDLKEANPGNYDVVVLDSINDLGLDLEDFKALKEANPVTAFVLILQNTKDGKFKGGKEWEHEVQIAGEVSNGTISIYKNRYGAKGTMNFFN